jgi:hypothetical protein
LIALTNYANYYGHVRQRNLTLAPATLGANWRSNRLEIPVAGPSGQRYDIHASGDLKLWQPIYTGYIGSSEDPFQMPASNAAAFYKAVSE